MKMAFRPGNVDLPDSAIAAAAATIDDERYFGENALEFNDVADTGNLLNQHIECLT